MQAYDLIMLIVLGMTTIFGAIKGFAWQVASLASIIVSYVIAYRFRFQVAEMIQAKPPWNQFLAMLILYVGTSFVIWVGFRLLSGMIDKVRLKEFDRHLGAAFGFSKGLIFCLLITMFAMSLLGPNQQSAICNSRSGYYIAAALDRGVGILPKEIHDVVGPYLTKLDDKLKTGQRETTPEPDVDGLSWPSSMPNIPSLPSSLVEGLPSLPGIGQASDGQAGNGWPWQATASAASPQNTSPQNTSAQNPSTQFPGTILPPSGSPENNSGLFSPQNFPPLTSEPPAYGSTQFGAPVNPPYNGLRPAGSSLQAQPPGLVVPR